jgi:hypothetical protein
VTEIFTETPVIALAPDQAAYEAWQRVRFPDNPVPWGHPALGSKTRNAWDAAAKAAIDAAGPGFTALEAERDKAYRERAALVAYLAACYPAEIVPAESDSGAWFLVFVTTPAGQMSWHLHEDDLDLFEPLLNAPETGVEWDGHTTEAKYERLAELTRTVATESGR